MKPRPRQISCALIVVITWLSFGFARQQDQQKSAFVVKGHTLGESVGDFIVEEPRVQIDIAECGKGKKAPKSTASGDCDRLQAMAAGGSMVTPPIGFIEERLDNRPSRSLEVDACNLDAGLHDRDFDLRFHRPIRDGLLACFPAFGDLTRFFWFSVGSFPPHPPAARYELLFRRTSTKPRATRQE